MVAEGEGSGPPARGDISRIMHTFIILNTGLHIPTSPGPRTGRRQALSASRPCRMSFSRERRLVRLKTINVLELHANTLHDSSSDPPIPNAPHLLVAGETPLTSRWHAGLLSAAARAIAPASHTLYSKPADSKIQEKHSFSVRIGRVHASIREQRRGQGIRGVRQLRMLRRDLA